MAFLNKVNFKNVLNQKTKFTTLLSCQSHQGHPAPHHLDRCPHLSSPIYSYFSIAVSFFKAILYKLYNPIVTVFKDKFLQRAGVMKRLLLKLFILITIKRLTSALKQTVIARHSFRTV